MKKCAILFLLFIAVLILAASLDKNSEQIQDLIESQPQGMALAE